MGLGQKWRDASETQQQDWIRDGEVPLDYSGPVAADWPQLLSIVEDRVHGKRASHSTAHWWHFERPRKELYERLIGLERVLTICRVSHYWGFAFLSSGMVYADSLIVFPFTDYAAFCLIQSRTHELWSRFCVSSMKDDLRYTPSDCFETFPFPGNWENRVSLEHVGTEYYEFRATLMVHNNEGITKTYNRFHDPYENDPEIAELRRLHTAMDQAVLDAYGWTDIPTDCEFLLDYEIDEETWGKKKKPYRWPDAVRDEVLARLLELNAQRAAEEVRAGLAGSQETSPDRASRVTPVITTRSGTLWDPVPE